MILATILRTHEVPSMVPWDKHYYLCDHLKIIFEELGITLFPAYAVADPEDICRVCDGLILPGSSKNVFPSYYGRERDPEAPYCEDEFATDKPIVEAFVKAGKPILGICGGIQVLNVLFGGTLIQRLPGHNETRHAICVAPDSFLWNVYGRETVEVNSYHGQNVDDVAPGFKVTARTKEGTVEAIEKGNIVGVQWHPEVDFEMDFFRTFVKEFLGEANV